MKLSFRHLAILIALLFSALSFIWMFAPQRLLLEWGIALTPSAKLIGRRAAAIYAGLAAMFWFARDTAPSPARSAMTIGLAVACGLLALLGLFELATCHAKPGIWIAVAIEVSLMLALLYFNRKKTDRQSSDSPPRRELSSRPRQAVLNSKKGRK